MRITPFALVALVTVGSFVYTRASQPPADASARQGHPSAEADVEGMPDRQLITSQTSGPVSLSELDTTHFLTALGTLARQAKIRVIAEGLPMRLVLPPTEALVIQNATIDDALVALARAYDYEMLRDTTEKGVYLLRKRYSDPRDLPAITMAETCASLEAIQRGMEIFSPKRAIEPEGVGKTLVLDLLATLSHDQKVALQQNGDLPVRSLLPAQQAAVRRSLYYLYLQSPSDYVAEALPLLKPTSNVALALHAPAGPPTLGVSLRRGANDGGERFVPLDTLGIRTSDMLPELPATPAQTAPRERRAGAEETNVRTVTLAGLAKTLNARDAADKTAPRIVVDPSLADKTILQVGDFSDTDAKKVFARVATLYGLALSRPDGPAAPAVPPSLRLARTPIPLMRQITNLPFYIHACLPEPMARAISGSAANALPLPTASKMTGHPPLPSKQMLEGRRSALVAAAAIDTLRDALPANASPKTRVAVSKLSAAQQQALAAVVLARFCNLAVQPDPHRRTVPDYLSQFDTVHLKGGPYRDRKGAPKYNMEFATIAADGKSNLGVAITNIPYHEF